MRARTIREGSVGLLILLGIGLFGGLVLWLRGFNPTNRPYELIAEFEDTMGVQLGTAVMYRGVPVGRVVSLTPQSNTVEVGMEITQRDLLIPNEVLVETVESGLIGEMSIEITPLTKLDTDALEMSATGPGCDSSLILCDGDRLVGVAGPSYEELLRSAGEVADLLADPELIEQLKTVLENVSAATQDAGVLAQEAIILARAAREEVIPLSASVQSATGTAARAAEQVGVAAEQFSITAADLNGLIGDNRGALVDTLGNLQATSLQLRSAADVIGPTFESGELLRNLETLVGNASAASADLQAVSSSLNTPANLVLLQQTLESARDALSSAQKVMADVDEITCDPAVRNQLRELINGLGALVSSTQTLEQEAEVARVLTPLGVQIGAQTNAQHDADSDSTNNIDAGEGLLEEDLAETNRPLLVFDGERYILRQRDRLAEKTTDFSPDKNQVKIKNDSFGQPVERSVKTQN